MNISYCDNQTYHHPCQLCGAYHNPYEPCKIQPFIQPPTPPKIKLDPPLTQITMTSNSEQLTRIEKLLERIIELLEKE